MKLILTIAITLLTITAINAQQTNQWRGMVLDQTTPEQALEAFGKPKADKVITNFRPLKYDELFGEVLSDSANFTSVLPIGTFTESCQSSTTM